MQLRPNQITPTQKAIDFLKKEQPPGIIIAPTAFGKSWLIAVTVQEVGGKILIVQPSKELLLQNVSKFRAIGGQCGIYSASAKEKTIGNITYATIGSIKKIGKEFKGYKLIIDECHLYPRSMDSMLGEFLTDSKITHVLGLTATPLKMQTNFDIHGNTFSKLVMLNNGSKHGNFFKSIVHCTQVQEMGEFWAKLVYDVRPFDDSKLEWNSTESDYTEESVMKTYELNSLETKIVNIVSKSDRKSIIVFVPSVPQAIKLAKLLPNFEAVYSGMQDRERDRIIDGFKDRSIRGVLNVNILATGFDHTGIDHIIDARSTGSFAWYYQAYGRGTRIENGKADCLITCLSGNVDRFGQLEYIRYGQIGRRWELYGQDNRQITGIPIRQIGLNYKQVAQNMLQDMINQKHQSGMPLDQAGLRAVNWICGQLGTITFANLSNDDYKKAVEIMRPYMKNM